MSQQDFENNQEILLDLADFALQEQSENNLMEAISWAWCNGSYNMTAKQIKSLELCCAMIQFLIMTNILTTSVFFQLGNWGEQMEWV